MKCVPLPVFEMATAEPFAVRESFEPAITKYREGEQSAGNHKGMRCEIEPSDGADTQKIWYVRNKRYKQGEKDGYGLLSFDSVCMGEGANQIIVCNQRDGLGSQHNRGKQAAIFLFQNVEGGNMLDLEVI